MRAGNERVRPNLDALRVLRLPWIDSGANSACANFGIAVRDRLGLRPGNERRDFDLEIERLRGAGQALVSLLVDEVLELVGRRGELLRGLLALQVSSRSGPSLRRTTARAPPATPFTLMTCHPNSDCTGPTISPGFAANAASSNDFTIVAARESCRGRRPAVDEPGSFEVLPRQVAELRRIGLRLGEHILRQLLRHRAGRPHWHPA